MRATKTVRYVPMVVRAGNARCLAQGREERIVSARPSAAQATASRVRGAARQWLQAEVERSRRALGPSWALYEAWVLGYLRAELAERRRNWR
jgi:hypothetical protein